MRAILGTSLVVLSACGAFGQPAGAPAFDVASVKMNGAGSGEGPAADGKSSLHRPPASP